MIHDGAQAQCGRPQQPEIAEVIDAGQRLQITLKVGIDITVEPDCPRGRSLQLIRRNWQPTLGAQFPPVVVRDGLRLHGTYAETRRDQACVLRAAAVAWP